MGRLLLALGWSALLLSGTASADTAGRYAWSDMCRAAGAGFQQTLKEMAGLPETLGDIARIMGGDGVCACVQEKMQEVGLPFIDNQADSAAIESGMLLYIHANASCMAPAVRAGYPALCPRLTAELLPRMGYGPDAGAGIGDICACSIQTLNGNFTEEALYDDSVLGFRQYQAMMQGRLDRDQLKPASGPLGLATASMKACFTRVLGEPGSARP